MDKNNQFRRIEKFKKFLGIFMKIPFKRMKRGRKEILKYSNKKFLMN